MDQAHHLKAKKAAVPASRHGWPQHRWKSSVQRSHAEGTLLCDDKHVEYSIQNIVCRGYRQDLRDTATSVQAGDGQDTQSLLLNMDAAGTPEHRCFHKVRQAVPIARLSYANVLASPLLLTGLDLTSVEALFAPRRCNDATWG